MVAPAVKYPPATVHHQPVRPAPRGLLTLEAAADRLGRARSTVWAWAAEGRLESRRVGTRHYVTEASVEAAARELGLATGDRGPQGRSGAAERAGEQNTQPRAVARPQVPPASPGTPPGAAGAERGASPDLHAARASSPTAREERPRESSAAATRAAPAADHTQPAYRPWKP